ncbi:hypothetical protein COBT_000672 [Conglomerata obtusa]
MTVIIMAPAEELQQCVFFAYKLTTEEEYKLMTTPSKHATSTPIARTEGNYLLPRSRDLLNATPVILEHHKIFESNTISNIIFGLLTCEPLYNLIVTFKDRTRHIPEMKLFNEIYFITAILRNQVDMSSSTECVSNELNEMCSNIKKMVQESSDVECYKKILAILHDEFQKRYIYTKLGWENPGDNAFKRQNASYKDLSPINDIFIGEIKRNKFENKICEVFDCLEIDGNCVENGIDNYFKQDKFRDDIESWFSKKPIVLVIFGRKVRSVNEVLIGKDSYVLKSVVDSKGKVLAQSNDCRILFYRKKVISVI